MTSRQKTQPRFDGLRCYQCVNQPFCRAAVDVGYKGCEHYDLFNRPANKAGSRPKARK